MSMPPVDAPARMTSPIEAPSPSPPNTAQSIGSRVSTTPSSSFSNSASVVGQRKVHRSVESANSRPSSHSASRNSKLLNSSMKVAAGKPVIFSTAREMPVVPPVSRPPGRRNSCTDSE